MAVYAVGDIQGCDDELGQLLSELDFSPSRDTLWFVGDGLAELVRVTLMGVLPGLLTVWFSVAEVLVA